MGIAEDVHSPVRLTEKMVRFFYRIVETKEHRAHLSVVGVEFVLNERIAVVRAAIFVVVVVKPIVLQSDFGGNCAPKCGQLIWLYVCVERDCKDSEFFHSLVRLD